MKKIILIGYSPTKNCTTANFDDLKKSFEKTAKAIEHFSIEVNNLKEIELQQLPQKIKHRKKRPFHN